MATMKEIYQLGLEAAAKLDGWLFTGIAPEGTREACDNAIRIAEEILPGIALSETLTLAEAYLEGNYEEAPYLTPDQNKCLFTAVAEEFKSLTPSVNNA